MSNLIDSHAHLYLPEFSDDREAMMQRTKEAGVDHIFLPNIDSGTIDALLDFEKTFPAAHAMMGLHPCSVNENAEEELNTVKQWLGRRKFAAVGEIGLDFYWDTTFKDQQIAAFTTQIEWALEYGLPIVIHARNATRECIDIVRSRQNGRLTGVFHCFSGTREEAAEIIELGFFLGIGGVATFKKSTLPGILEHIEPAHLLLETDAPYLAPVPHRGKRNESSYIPLVAAKVAEIKGMDPDRIAAVTTENALQLFAD